MHKILLVGNFLSSSYGTSPVMEKVAGRLSPLYQFHLASNKRSILARALDMVSAAMFHDYKLIHIDVYSNLAFWFAYFTSVIAKIRKKPILLTLHGGALPQFHEKKSWFVNRLLWRANIILTPSNYIKNYFTGFGFTVSYIPNAVDLETFSFSFLPVENQNYRILWVRAFGKIYNPHIPVYVLKEVIREFPSATLTMVGPDKGLLKEVKALISRLNLEDRVFITGPLNNDRLNVIYQTHNVYLNTPSYESFGVALVEAACSGIPIVSCGVGEIPYNWVDQKEMLILNLSAIELAVAIKDVFRNRQLSEKMVKHARAKAEQFNWNVIKEKWILLFNNFLS